MGATDEQAATLKNEIKFHLLAWKELVTVLLTEIADYAEIEGFLGEVLDRASYINHYKGKKLHTLFKDKLVPHLPKYDEKTMDAQFKSII